MFHKKAKTTKKIVLRLQCQVCKAVHMHPIKVSLWMSGSADCKVVTHHDRRPSYRVQRCKHFEIGGDKKGKNQMY